MKIAHEAPIELLGYVRNKTDYEYALVHLFEKYPVYYDFMKESLSMGRVVILDNSLFELGESFDPDKFADWIKKLKPTEYVVPDVWQKGHETKQAWMNWNSKFKDLPGKKIGVVQGENLGEMISCYEFMAKHADKIAINFGSDVYRQIIMGFTPNDEKRLMLGRMKFLDTLVEQKIINKNKPHHLLGCAIPSEFDLYAEAPERYGFIESIDTSNPVMAAILQLRYDRRYGLDIKPGKGGEKDGKDLKMANLMTIRGVDKELLDYNLKIFKIFISGKKPYEY